MGQRPRMFAVTREGLILQMERALVDSSIPVNNARNLSRFCLSAPDSGYNGVSHETCVTLLVGPVDPWAQWASKVAVEIAKGATLMDLHNLSKTTLAKPLSCPIRV